MSNLFIKYPENAKQQEAIINLQNVKFIEKNDAFSSTSENYGYETKIYCIAFHNSHRDYFSYMTKDKKTRDDFFDAILQKLSLNNIKINQRSKQLRERKDTEQRLYKYGFFTLLAIIFSHLILIQF